MFGVGAWELVLIAFVALLVFFAVALAVRLSGRNR
jgi:Sec-independent protein translocase protein TatA